MLARLVAYMLSKILILLSFTRRLICVEMFVVCVDGGAR